MMILFFNYGRLVTDQSPPFGFQPAANSLYESNNKNNKLNLCYNGY